MNTLISSINRLLLRDLDKLEKEISLYPNQNSIWQVKGDIINPAGNLCLHLCGNLQHYIGAVLGNSGYIRNREKEFSLKDISAKDLILEIMKTKEAIKNTLAELDPALMEKEYPEKVFAEPMTTQHFLLHLSTHLGYHLGQVNYHRRMIG